MKSLQAAQAGILVRRTPDWPPMRGGSDTIANRGHVQLRLTWILRSVAPIYSGRKPQ